MKVVFRADASVRIGTGHVMRCLTLANALHEQGATCTFICRGHLGHLTERIRAEGHVVYVLAMGNLGEQGEPPLGSIVYSPWLGATQEHDVNACRAILEVLQPDWLIVDHYALDAEWESALKGYCHLMMVIDDLADRPHKCDILLDQNFGRKLEDYQGLVPEKCVVLVGPRYALLRPEFAAMREYSLARRQRLQLKHLLITMGGVDVSNGTGWVLDALKLSNLPTDCRITVVMGRDAPHLAAVQAQVRLMPWPTNIFVDINDMAQRMADSDICIGAAGSTSWERCCMGLPAIVAVLADNQQAVAQVLADECAAFPFSLTMSKDELSGLVDLVAQPVMMRRMIQKASTITDGAGTERVRQVMLSWGAMPDNYSLSPI